MIQVLPYVVKSYQLLLGNVPGVSRENTSSVWKGGVRYAPTFRDNLYNELRVQMQIRQATKVINSPS